MHARRLVKRGLKSFGYLKHHPIRETWPQNRDRKWHPILSEPSRTGNTREIEDIGKVCKLHHEDRNVSHESVSNEDGERRTFPNL